MVKILVGGSRAILDLPRYASGSGKMLPQHLFYGRASANYQRDKTGQSYSESSTTRFDITQFDRRLTFNRHYALCSSVLTSNDSRIGSA